MRCNSPPSEGIEFDSVAQLSDALRGVLITAWAAAHEPLAKLLRRGVTSEQRARRAMAMDRGGGDCVHGGQRPRCARAQGQGRATKDISNNDNNDTVKRRMSQGTNFNYHRHKISNPELCMPFCHQPARAPGHSLERGCTFLLLLLYSHISRNFQKSLALGHKTATIASAT